MKQPFEFPPRQTSVSSRDSGRHIANFK